MKLKKEETALIALENILYLQLYILKDGSYVITGKKKPLGEVTDQFSRVEFQNQGSPMFFGS